MTPEEEFAIGSQLKWTRDGNDYVLLRGRRRTGRVTPDQQYPGMWRSPKSGGRVSDMANLSWAKDAVMAEATRGMAASKQPDKAPLKTQQNMGVNRHLKANHSLFRPGPPPVAKIAFNAPVTRFSGDT
jgi:hypothetical protein